MPSAAPLLAAMTCCLTIAAAACDRDDDNASGVPRLTGAVTCARYCDTVLSSCGTVTGTDGGHAQYLSKTGCMSQCAKMELGTVNDGDVDTVACRLRYAEQAATSPGTLCRAAGSNGGGRCGDRCAVFCSQALARCGPGKVPQVPFESASACLSACQSEPTFRLDPAKAEVFFKGPDLNCRIAHLVAAYDPGTGFGPPDGHCWHVDVPGSGGFCGLSPADGTHSDAH